MEDMGNYGYTLFRTIPNACLYGAMMGLKCCGHTLVCPPFLAFCNSLFLLFAAFLAFCSFDVEKVVNSMAAETS